MTSQNNELSTELYESLARLSHCLHHFSHQTSRSSGFPQEKRRDLRFIAANSGLSQKELANKLAIKPASATVKIQKMVTEGLISKRKDSKDARFTNLYLTEDGQILLSQLNREAQPNFAELFSNLSESEQLTMLDLSQKINQKFHS